MSRLAVFVLTSLALASLATLDAPRAHAQSTRTIALFPHQASITEPPSSYGLVRLPLGPDVLEGAASDLSDVRIHDLDGLEVPYAIDRGDVVYPTSRVGERRSVVPYDASEETTRTGAVTTSREIYRVRPPSPPSYGGTWQLLIEPPPGEVIRQVVVRAEPAFGEPREVTRTSIFRFARWGNERLAIMLPGVSDEPLVIELSGEGPPIHPSFGLREVEREVSESATVDVPLAIRETRREGTRTVLLVARPRGFRTESITIDASTPSFLRSVEVRAPGASGPSVLGTGGLVRVTNLDIPELRVVRLAEGGGDVLEVVIEDGDSPSLADVTVTAAARVPVLLFDAGRARMLRWGGHRARAPHYDLMNADLAAYVRDRILVTPTLGPIEPNPEHDATPALTFAMRAGQSVDLAGYTHRAPLTVRNAHDGLSRFAIPPAVWAEAREDLADLRVIDAEGRQWPYVLTISPPNDELEASVEAAVPNETTPHHSIHRVTLPVPTMSPTVVRIELPPQLVARMVSARGRNERGEELELGVASFLSNEDAPARLELSLFGGRITALWLDVDDGDEAPLTIGRVTLVQAGHEAQLVAPAGEYAVVVGDLEATAPSYDVADAWELLAVLEAEDATLGELAPNPEFHEPTFFERSGWQTFVLSALLGLVVIVLFVMTLRIARSESEAAAPPAKPERAKAAADAAKPEQSSAKADEEISKAAEGTASTEEGTANSEEATAKPEGATAKPGEATKPEATATPDEDASKADDTDEKEKPPGGDGSAA